MLTSTRLVSAALAAVFCAAPLALAQEKKIDPGAARAKVARKAGGVEVGDTVAWLAKYELKTVQGDPVTFGDWFKRKGKDKAKEIKEDDGLLLITFWSSTCPWQKMWDPEIAAIAEEYQEAGLTTVAINSNVEEIKNLDSSKARIAESKLPFKIALDSGNELADLFGAKTTPHIFLVNAKGKVIYTGAVDNDAKRALPAEKRETWLRNAIDAHFASEKIEVTATKPKGCTIKRAERAVS